MGKELSNVEIPEPVFYKEFNNFPFCLIIFRKIIGKELLPKFITESNMDSITKQLAEFMYQLHVLDSHKFISCIISQYISDSQVLHVIEAKTKESLLNYFDKNELLIMSDIWKELKKQSKSGSSSLCIIHGDLWFENILFDPSNNKITAVLDFENVSFDHPIFDFVSLRYYGETFLNNVLMNYNKLSRNQLLHWSENEFIIYSFYREINGLYNNLLVNSIETDYNSKIKVILDNYKKMNHL